MSALESPFRSIAHYYVLFPEIRQGNNLLAATCSQESTESPPARQPNLSQVALRFSRSRVKISVTFRLVAAHVDIVL
jgi:hypothetical protein